MHDRCHDYRTQVERLLGAIDKQVADDKLHKAQLYRDQMDQAVKDRKQAEIARKGTYFLLSFRQSFMVGITFENKLSASQILCWIT